MTDGDGFPIRIVARMVADSEVLQVEILKHLLRVCISVASSTFLAFAALVLAYLSLLQFKDTFWMWVGFWLIVGCWVASAVLAFREMRMARPVISRLTGLVKDVTELREMLKSKPAE
jgi:hypothetical protein